MPVAEPTPNVNIKGRFNKNTHINNLSWKPLFSYHLNRMVQYYLLQLLHLQDGMKYPKRVNKPMLMTSARWLRGPGVLQSWVVEMSKHIWEV